MMLRVMGFEDIAFNAEYPTLLIIENHKLFAHINSALYDIVNNKISSDEILIIENDKVIKNNRINLIFSPLDINLNNKTIVNKICDNIALNIRDQNELLTCFNEYISMINRLIINELNDYNVNFHLFSDVTINQYLKLLNIKIDDNGIALFDNLLNYVEIYSEILPNSIIIFIGILQYFDDTQVAELVKYISYKKVNTIFIENYYNRSFLFKRYIIDNDFCLHVY